MTHIDAVDVVKFIHTEIANLKQSYKQGKIDIKTLQASARTLNNVVRYISFLASQKNN